jgi:hypothetical protein
MASAKNARPSFLGSGVARGIGRRVKCIERAGRPLLRLDLLRLILHLCACALFLHSILVVPANEESCSQHDYRCGERDDG